MRVEGGIGTSRRRFVVDFLFVGTEEHVVVFVGCELRDNALEPELVVVVAILDPFGIEVPDFEFLIWLGVVNEDEVVDWTDWTDWASVSAGLEVYWCEDAWNERPLAGFGRK